MFYAKHPVLGNRHFSSVDRAEMEADGWVFWPHGSGLPAYKAAPEPCEIVPAAPGSVEVVKRRPGRPKKV